jgi:Na+/phosphate symporter
MSKKITGYIFIGISIILGLAIIGRIPKLLSDISAFPEIFTGNKDTADISYAITTLLIWILHFVLVITLWNEGQKRIRMTRADKK